MTVPGPSGVDRKGQTLPKMDNKNSKTGKGQKPKRKVLKAHVTHLEMHHPLSTHIPVPTRPVLALMRAENIPVHFYRYLYELVGKEHHWQERRLMGDRELSQIINGEDYEINVLYADGCPAGFFEISTEGLPESTEIIYFGIGPDHQGLGIGKWFLSAAIRNAWIPKPKKVKIHTNTLDNPAALALYQRLGFSPVSTSDEEIIPWE